MLYLFPMNLKVYGLIIINYKETQYRIVYEIYPENQIILVIMIGTREGFYQALRRRVR